MSLTCVLLYDPVTVLFFHPTTDHSPLDEPSTYSHADFLGGSENKIGSFLPQGLFFFFLMWTVLISWFLKCSLLVNVSLFKSQLKCSLHTEAFPAAVNTPPLPICDGQFYVLTWVGYILQLFNKTLI